MLFPSPSTGSASVVMASFGENLRREREMRGVNLEEISASTRIGVRFLQALEENDFAALPGGIFTRSFIRSYASYLGLDQEAVMAEFQTLAPPDEQLDFNRLGTKPSSGSRRGRSPVLLWMVAAALLAGGWALYRYSHRAVELQSRAVAVTSSSAPAATPLSPPPAQPAATPAGVTTGGTSVPNGPNATIGSGGETPAVSASSASVAGGSPGPAPGSAPPGTQEATSTANPPAALPSAGSASSPTAGTLGQGDLLLQVATTERVWLAVSADGKKIFQRTLDPNAVQTFRASESFDVTTGNAQGTILTLNGETQKPLGRHGELKKLHLTRQSFQSP